MYFNRLKDLRNDRDLTQEDIAKILKKSRNTYKNWENGTIMIPLEIADELSVFYNVRLSYILGIDKSSKTKYKIKKMNYNTLLENLKHLKEINKNSYEEISTCIKCGKSICYYYFIGKVKIPMDRLIMLAELYNQDLDKLCGKE